MLYHINPRSKDVSPCRAEKGNCPFGSVDTHFENPQDAYRAAEKQLDAEYGQGKPQTKMVESYAEWEARRWGPKEPATGPGLPQPNSPVDAYRAMLPVQHGEIAKYCYEKGLNLEETQAVGEVLKRYKDPLKGGPSALVTRALQERIREADNNCKKVDAALAQSPFFTSARLRSGKNGLTYSSYSTMGKEDYITHVGEDGSLKFEVYDHETLESSWGSSPNQFVDDNVPGMMNSWVSHYNAYRESIWLRIQWEREKRARVERAGTARL